MTAPSRRPRNSSRLRTALDQVLVHDIRNMGFRLQMLRANLDEHYGDPEFKRSLQDFLASSIDRLERIVGRWSREAPAVLVKVELDVNGILREIAEGAPRRGARYSEAAPSRRPVLALSLGAVPSVWGDSYLLRDALSSLVENAMEAAPPSGKVVIRSFPLGKGSRTRAGVEIIDNGAGMSKQFLQDRLFLPFQTTKPDGVGLGLSTASEIVRNHRGTIRVRSEPGLGTVVRLSFPSVRSDP
jgi:signal transduction histidine kinase